MNSTGDSCDRCAVGAIPVRPPWALLTKLALSAALFCVPLAAQHPKRSQEGAPASEDFFIVSSVDLPKQQILLKLPSEVTEVMRVNDKTRYQDKNGKPLKIADLRAGDTLYIKSVRNTQGALAISIRLGAMTPEELHRRYLRDTK